jgi:Protein of unknown function (DUF998)
MVDGNGCIYASISPAWKGVPAMKLLRSLAVLTVVGETVLLASAWVLPAVSEYRLLSDNISELALGRFGFIQTLAFVLSGLGVIGLAYVIRQLIRGSRGSSVASVLIGIYGLAGLIVAIFPTDRIDSSADVVSQSTTGWVHSLTALVAYISVTVGMFILTWTFARHADWRPLVVWSTLLAGATLALLFMQMEGPWVGLMQRLLTTIVSGWLILVAIRSHKIASAAATVDEANSSVMEKQLSD